MRFRLAVNEPNWPLFTGGRCSEVVVKAGLTVDVCYDVVSKVCYFKGFFSSEMFVTLKRIEL